jgi:hypothetical protein
MKLFVAPWEQPSSSHQVAPHIHSRPNSSTPLAIRYPYLLPFLFNMPATRNSKRKTKTTAKQVSKIPEVAQEPEQGEEQGVVAEVAEAAEEFVDQMTGVEEGSNPEENGNGNGNDGQERSEGATTNGSDAPKLTMEERKAKLTQLRKKIVRLFVILYFLHPSYRILLNRLPLQKPTAPLLLKRVPKPKSPHETPQD